MAKFELTPQSEADVEAIAEYTLQTWGVNQCERYLAELQACFQELADHPRLGRRCDDIRPGLMRMEQGRHVVFYRQKERVSASSASFTSGCCRVTTYWMKKDSLAAFAIAHGMLFASHDPECLRFAPELEWTEPLTPAWAA